MSPCIVKLRDQRFLPLVHIMAFYTIRFGLFLTHFWSFLDTFWANFRPVRSHGHTDELLALDWAAAEPVSDGGAVGVPAASADASTVAAGAASAAGGDVPRVVF